MRINIREIQLKDYPQTIEMIKRTHRISFAKVYPAELIEEFCKKYDLERFTEKVKQAKYFIAEDLDSNQIKGIIGLRDNELRTFFVDPDAQGQGIGRMLYDTFEKTALSLGITQIVVQGSPLGQPIYEKFGFKKVDEAQKERGGIKYTDAVMKKDLTK